MTFITGAIISLLMVALFAALVRVVRDLPSAEAWLAEMGDH